MGKRHINKKILYRILAFAIPVVILLAIYISREYYPFGNRGILAADLYHQYMPFFQEFMDKLKTGMSLDFSWNIGIGSNFLALFTYYLASPVNFLCVFVPGEFLMEWIALLILLKMGGCGLTACMLFQSKGEENSVKPLLVSLFYAFSGFLCAYYYNIMWLDVVLLAPLVVMGLEALVKEGKWKMYTLALGLSILSNFYLSIMLCMFVVLYYLYLILAEGFKFKRGLLFAGTSLMAGALAAVLLVPEVLVMMGTDFANSDFPTGFRNYFGVLEVLSRQCMGVTVEKALDHWPNIYCGVAVYLLVPLFLLNKGIPVKKRFGMGALAGLMLLSFSIGNLDFIWHGMNYPDSLPARESFLYILLLLCICYECLLHLKELENNQIVGAVIGACGYLLLMEKLGLSDDFEAWTILLNIVFVVAYGVALYILKQGTEGFKRFVLLCASLCIVVGEVTANVSLTSFSSVSRSGYLNRVEDHKALYAEARQETEGFWRMEKFVRKTKNDGALYQIPTASCFSSTLNSNVMRFYQKFGMRYSKVFYEYGGATPFVAGLLNVGYMLDETDKDSRGERENVLYSKVDESGMMELYKLNYAVPFGYVLPYEYTLPQGYAGSGIGLQNKMAEELLGEKATLFEKVNATEIGNLLEFDPQTEGYYFGVVKTSKIKKAVMTGGHPAEFTFKDLKKDETIEIGWLEKGETVYLSDENESSDAAMKADVYRLNIPVWEKLYALLCENHMRQVETRDNGVSGEITLSEQGRVILSVPVEKGMEVLVNGEQTEPKSFGGALLAIDLDPGEYHIEVTYKSPGKVPGLAISAMELALLAFLFFFPKIREKLLARGAKKVQNESDL